MDRLVIFCAKGHIADTDAALSTTPITACPACQETSLKAVPNWPNEGTAVVPATPLQQDVYNVESLFADDDGCVAFPALAGFCSNGHLAWTTNAAEFLEVDQLSPCEVCASTKFRAVANWPTAGTELVPADPIGEENNEGEFPIFEVKDLFSGDYPVDWVIDLEAFESQKEQSDETGER